MLSFDEIVNVWDAHADRLLLIVRVHGDLAEDAVQEAFLALARQSRIPDSPLAWLVTVARNHIAQQWRAEARRAKRHQEVVRDKRWFASERSLQMLDAQEAVEALRQLDPIDAEIVMLHVWGEMTFSQIADITGMSRATVHRSYVATLNALRKKLDSQPKKLIDVKSKR